MTVIGQRSFGAFHRISGTGCRAILAKEERNRRTSVTLVYICVCVFKYIILAGDFAKLSSALMKLSAPLFRLNLQPVLYQ